nr:HAMP domain-containing sensor histidine kinase [Quadrisphaera sp. RL12-1S]
MSAQVDRWSTDDPEQRLGQDHRPTELAELSSTLDGLLARIAAVLRHERLLTAELSHELRTPLAQLQAELDWLRSGSRTAQEREESLAALDASAGRMRAVVDALLASARTSSAAPGRCDVASALAAAVQEVTGPPGSHDDGGPAVTLDLAEGLAAGVEAALLERAVAPLLSNAVRHARGRVAVSARREGHDVVVSVRDDGAGIPAAVVGQVLEPGFRGAPDDGHPGAGLGLALAQRLAASAGGAVVPHPAGPDGGGAVDLVVPGA